jgi:uroporphyrin-III C-methyltransferase / precorrin-2 dehydrogenase / sirohydrochlorin ferrochelatase
MCPSGFPDRPRVKQLPIFVNLDGQKVILLGEGDAADAKRRLIERAGGICVGEEDESCLAFIAMENERDALAARQRLKARGLLVNVVDRPTLCDFTTPAIVDRDPVLIAIGTGGASAGLAKALRQRLEQIMPAQLGSLAQALFSARKGLHERFPDSADRRRALDAVLDEGGPLDPMTSLGNGAVECWLDDPARIPADRTEILVLRGNDPDELTLRQARLLGQADTLVHDRDVSSEILNRARADAVRIMGSLPERIPPGLTLYLKLQSATSA